MANENLLAIVGDDSSTLVRDLWPDLEKAMKAVDGDCKGKLVIEASIEEKDGEVTLEVTGKATHPKLYRADRKLIWKSGQLELFKGASAGGK